MRGRGILGGGLTSTCIKYHDLFLFFFFAFLFFCFLVLFLWGGVYLFLFLFYFFSFFFCGRMEMGGERIHVVVL